MAAKYPYYHLADDHPQISQMNADEEIKSHLRPFSRSETGKIAVKVINHYGDEVLKVFEVS